MTDKETTAPGGISRRSVLLGAAAGTLALNAGALTPEASAATFVKGAAGYSPFAYYDMTAWASNRRPTAAMDGFLNV
jgi:hypothetical protein